MLILVFVAKIYFFFVFWFLWRQHASFEKYIFFYTLNYYNSKIIWTHLNIHYTHSLIKFYSKKKTQIKLLFNPYDVLASLQSQLQSLHLHRRLLLKKVGFNFINEINVFIEVGFLEVVFLVLNPSEPLCYGRTTWASHPYLTFKLNLEAITFGKTLWRNFKKKRWVLYISIPFGSWLRYRFCNIQIQLSQLLIG